MADYFQKLIQRMSPPTLAGPKPKPSLLPPVNPITTPEEVFDPFEAAVELPIETGPLQPAPASPILASGAPLPLTPQPQVVRPPTAPVLPTSPANVEPPLAAALPILLPSEPAAAPAEITARPPDEDFESHDRAAEPAPPVVIESQKLAGQFTRPAPAALALAEAGLLSPGADLQAQPGVTSPRPAEPDVSRPVIESILRPEPAWQQAAPPVEPPPITPPAPETALKPSLQPPPLSSPPPPEAPRVVIGRLQVEVVPTPPPAAPARPPARSRPRPSSRSRSGRPGRSKLRFGLGQL